MAYNNEPMRAYVGECLSMTWCCDTLPDTQVDLHK